MVQLQILSGRKAGAKFDGANFPIIIGRSEKADLSLDDSGIWPSHCKIQWQSEGLVLETEPDALTSVNGNSVTRTVLRNGDLITFGAATIRFGLSPVRQAGVILREWLTWAALAGLCAGEVTAIYWINS